MTAFWAGAGKALRSALTGGLLATSAYAPALAQATPPVDYLGLPGPIEFAGLQYHLVWSAKPAANYVKHEYLPLGQLPASYEDMVIVELLTSGLSVADASKAQILSLEQRKSRDPLVNYQVMQSPDHSQVVLDFLLSDESTGSLTVEWNAYRYVAVEMSNGGKAVVLFAVSRRHYGDDASTFLKVLKTRRTTDVGTLMKLVVPGAMALR